MNRRCCPPPLPAPAALPAETATSQDFGSNRPLALISPAVLAIKNRVIDRGRRPFAARGLSRLGLLFALAAAAGAGAGGSWWWQQRQAAQTSATAPSDGAAPSPAPKRFGAGSRSLPVSVGQARTQDLRVVLPAIGTMAALNTAVVRTRVDGILQTLHFKEGQAVKAGALLAEIDPRPFEVALAQAQGQLARDQAQLRNARTDLARYQDLLAKDSIAQQQVDTQAALVQQLQGQVQADQAAVDAAKLQLTFTKVQAPISGQLGLKQADLGSLVRSTDANGLVSITQTQPIALVFAVPDLHLAAIQDALRAKRPLVVEAWDREQKTKLGEGRVTSTDNAIDSATATLKLKAEFANADGRLFPNQFVQVRLQLNTLRDQLTVPATAVQRGARGSFVYKVQDDGSVSLRPVRVGASEGDWVAVQGELAAGDTLVTDGADRLRDGAKVEVIAPRSPGNGAAGGGRGRRG